MSLSNEERRIIVNRELEKSERTFDDVLFFVRMKEDGKLLQTDYTMPCSMLCRHFSFVMDIM